MRTSHHRLHRCEYLPAGFFVLRTPLLPLDAFENWTATAKAAAGPASFRERERHLRQGLRDALEDARIREALRLASPSLCRRLSYWHVDPSGPKGRKIESAVVKYFTRMCSRSTPFGLFAGVSIGHVDTATRLRLDDPRSYRRHARLDGGFACTLAEHLLKDGITKAQLKFFPNDSIYRSGDRYRFVEYDTVNGARRYKLSAVASSPALASALSRSAHGVTLPDLSAYLAGSEDVDEDEAAAFVAAMVDCRLLISELEPAITGDGAFDVMAAKLSRLDDRSAAVDAALSAHRKIQSLNGKEIGVAGTDYEAILADFAQAGAQGEISEVLQVDMFKPAEGLRIDAGLVREIEHCARLVYAATARPAHALDDFIGRFVARYDRRRVPLVDVLDEEKGIGFGTGGIDRSHLLGDLPFPPPDSPPAGTHSALDRYLTRRLLEAMRAHSDEIVIDEADLAGLAQADLPPPPPSICAKVVPTATDGDGIRTAWVRFLPTSGSALFARFCHGDETLRRCTARLVADEARLSEGAVVAEVVHLPQGRTGNVIARPHLTDYEIVFLGRSGRPPDKQIKLDDLLVSVEQGTLKLWSKTLDRQILPRMSTAHHYANNKNLGAYQFLASLQSHGTGVFQFGWPVHLRDMPSLPRVRLGRLHLINRQWNVSPSDVAGLRQAYECDAPGSFAEALRRLRLPRFVSIVQNDHVLPVDFDNPLSVRVLFELAKDTDTLRLEETYVPARDAAVRDDRGSFASEIFLPFIIANGGQARQQIDPAPAGRSGSRTHPVAGDDVVRAFAPGSECLYLKIYCGTATADRLIGDVLHDAMAAFMSRGQVERWFFVRYADPEHHLRLRLFGSQAALWGPVLAHIDALLRPYMADASVWKIQADTYERELERYGGADGIEACERIFHADSEAVARLIQVGKRCSPEMNSLHAILGVDRLLNDFSLDAAARLHLLRKLAAGFRSESRGGKDLEIALGEKYRGMRERLQALLGERHGAASIHPAALDILAQRSHAVRRETGILIERLGSVALPEICASVIHMFVNRFFKSRQRRHEMVIYDLLWRHEESLARRGRPKAPA
jgi:lantibiotic biosynthesis protein